MSRLEPNSLNPSSGEDVKFKAILNAAFYTGMKCYSLVDFLTSTNTDTPVSYSLWSRGQTFMAIHGPLILRPLKGITRCVVPSGDAGDDDGGCLCVLPKIITGRWFRGMA